MKGLDLRKFKKLHSDENTTTLKHPQGHEIKIAHNKVSEDIRKQLKELPKFSEGGLLETMQNWVNEPETTAAQSSSNRPIKPLDQGKVKDFTKGFEGDAKGGMVPHYDEGGDVQTTDDESPFNQAANSLPMSVMSTIPGLEQVARSAKIASDLGIPDTVKNIMSSAPEQPATNPTVSQTPAQPGQQFMMPPNPANIMQEGIEQTGTGIESEATAHGNVANQQAQIQQHAAQQMQDLANTFQQKSAENEQNIASTIKDIKDGHIDPDHYINSQSAPAKISTAIGLILGGMGAMAGGGNVALDYLNKQIDRDVEAQKANLANKNNLMSAFQHQFNNLQDATTMTKAVYSEMYADQLAQAASKSGSPLAQAAAQQAIGQLKLKYGPEIQQMNIRQSVLQGAQKGTVLPEQAVTWLVPPEQQSKAFDEIKNHRLLENTTKQIADTLQQVKGMQTYGNRAFSPFQSTAQINAANQKINSLVKELYGKVSDNEINLIKQSQVGFTDNQDTVNKKIKNLQDIVLKHDISPTLTGHGINLNKPAVGFNKR
jgi:hypothetical protein